jgi:hypothetical protein
MSGILGQDLAIDGLSLGQAPGFVMLQGCLNRKRRHWAFLNLEKNTFDGVRRQLLGRSSEAAKWEISGKMEVAYADTPAEICMATFAKQVPCGSVP